MLKTLKNAFFGVKHGHIVHLERKMMLRACAGLKEWLKLFMLKKSFSKNSIFFKKIFTLKITKKVFFFWILAYFRFPRETKEGKYAKFGAVSSRMKMATRSQKMQKNAIYVPVALERTCWRFGNKH